LIGNKESKIAPGRLSFRWECSIIDLKGDLQETLLTVFTKLREVNMILEQFSEHNF
jgi:hypothetical protein